MTLKIKHFLGFCLLLELFIEQMLKNSIKWLWLQLKDWKNLVLFLLWWLICGSPTWIGYFLYFITKNPWHLAYANACIAFWAGPGTPEIPLCIALTIGTRKILSSLFKKTR